LRHVKKQSFTGRFKNYQVAVTTEKMPFAAVKKL